MLFIYLNTLNFSGNWITRKAGTGTETETGNGRHRWRSIAYIRTSVAAQMPAFSVPQSSNLTQDHPAMFYLSC